MGKQDLLDSYYDLNNLVSIDITMEENDWQALKNAQPRGGFGYKGPRYDWYHATSVTISGTKSPKQTTFSDVGIIKKSFAGSFSTTKPSVRLDFAKYNPSNEDGIESLIGTKRVVLNNSIQDPAYVRQPLGYHLIRQADLPAFRCNFARVTVNGAYMGAYVNIESFAKQFADKNFNGNDKGNYYEVEYSPDDDPEGPPRIDQGNVSFEGFSKFEDMADLHLAADKIQDGDGAAVAEVVDIDAFLRFYAMEALLKHWDGYTAQDNNAFIYNDRKAVANPSPADVKLKWVPSGIDQIMQQNRNFEFGQKSAIGNFVRSDEVLKAKLSEQIVKLGKDVFGEDKRQRINDIIDFLTETLAAAGVEGASIKDQIDNVKQEIQLIAEDGIPILTDELQS